MRRDEIRAPGPAGAVAPAGLRRVVAAGDRLLRKRMGILDISARPECILRLQLVPATRPFTSHDGVTVQPGDTIGRLHFVNENLPVLAAEGATLRWAVAFGQMLRSSLHDLATYLDDHAELDAVALFEGRFGFVTADEAERTVALAARFGFEFSYQPSPGLRFWTAGFWENLGTWVMIRAFNPAGLHTKSFTHLMRATVRMTRTTLITH
ncbi:MAG: hypothetical protein GX604_01205 [Actinobacteria bacterium]|nr:hypothetical protein [Actinomycetota bacterium]